MCYNCGCDILDDNMGSVDNITTDTFEKAAKVWGQGIDKAKIETYKSLKKELTRKKLIK